MTWSQCNRLWQMFEQRTAVVWPLCLPAKKGLHLSLKSVLRPRSFLAGQGNTAQLSGFTRTRLSHTSKGGQLLRQSSGSNWLWQLCKQMDPAATSPVCCLTPPRSRRACCWTASREAGTASFTQKRQSLRVAKALIS